MDEDELQCLIVDPLGEAWEDPALEKKLKARLPRAYELYLSIISQMNETMTELHGVLNIDVNNIHEEMVDEVSGPISPLTFC